MNRGKKYKVKFIEDDYVPCRTCGKVVHRSEMTFRANGWFKARQCKACRANDNKRYWRTKKLKEFNLKSNRLSSKKCEICGKEIKLYIDHDHKTGAFRGMLCNNCNLAMGLFQDDVGILKSAIKYLEKGSTKTNKSP